MGRRTATFFPAIKTPPAKAHGQMCVHPAASIRRVHGQHHYHQGKALSVDVTETCSPCGTVLRSWREGL